MNITDLDRELLLRFLDGRLKSGEFSSAQDLLRTNEAARNFLRDIAEHAVMVADIERMSVDCRVPTTGDRTARRLRTSKGKLPRILLFASAFVVVFVASNLLLYHFSANEKENPGNDTQVASTPSPVARITGLSGSLIWRGDRGEVVSELTIGTELAGGTIEGMAPDSWFELMFRDNSTVMIAGVSMLTFSDLGQKELRLKEGSLSANVVSQPEGKPMLVHTRSALLKVLGTRFEVEVELDSTALHVSEGAVQLKRLSDGRTIDVPARHRIAAASDGRMSAEPTLDAVHDWKSQLQLGPKNTYGKWSPAADANPASLKGVPFVPQENQAITLQMLGLSVRRTDNSPVVVLPGSRFVVRGRLTTASDVYFGIRVARPNGEFAGKFLARNLATQFENDCKFESVFHLSQFGLDPCVWDRKDELPSKPDGLVLTCAWTFTYPGGPSGLEVTEIELIPPENDERHSNP